MHLFLAEEFHDIAPPVDYSLVPVWLIFVAVFATLLLLGLVVWLILRARRRPKPAPTARDTALGQLRLIETELETMNPYQFSIRVSDILRRYVTEQYDVPSTRQTSVEFLNAVAKAARFSESEKSLLAEFLNRCDLIKFARYDATTHDSRRLLEEATQFVQGGKLDPA